WVSAPPSGAGGPRALRGAGGFIVCLVLASGWWTLRARHRPQPQPAETTSAAPAATRAEIGAIEDALGPRAERLPDIVHRLHQQLQPAGYAAEFRPCCELVLGRAKVAALLSALEAARPLPAEGVAFTP